MLLTRYEAGQQHGGLFGRLFKQWSPGSVCDSVFSWDCAMSGEAASVHLLGLLVMCVQLRQCRAPIEWLGKLHRLGKRAFSVCGLGPTGVVRENICQCQATHHLGAVQRSWQSEAKK